MPPIFEPEAIAREIVRAAIEAPRELWIGRSSLKAIIGALLMPSVADLVLASEGYSRQMTSASEPAGRPDNLFEPVSGDRGARGRFSNRSEDVVFGISGTSARVGLACLVAVALAVRTARSRKSVVTRT